LAASVAAGGKTLTLIPGAIESVACAFLDGSACGVAVRVTLFGFGAVAGAVYCAETVETFPFCVCVVVPLIVPHEAPLHPGPLSVHAMAVLGFEPGMAVSVSSDRRRCSTGTLDGAESCSEKLLVIVSAAETCFEGSATLCAVNVTLAGEGRICGAVYVPAASTLPQLLGHAAPDKLHRVEESGCPLLATEE
jgi:hypothetical protein